MIVLFLLQHFLCYICKEYVDGRLFLDHASSLDYDS